MKGAVDWNGQPAFDLDHLPGLLLVLLQRLKKAGWDFTGSMVSFAVRQHDMVLLGEDGELLEPALSWRCNAALREVKGLRENGAEKVVGRVEERFILPKLMWALRQAPGLQKKTRCVMTTGDWVAYMLTGKSRLSTSDALSNGLLVQKTKKLANAVMRKAGIEPHWFPRIIQSGCVVGSVSPDPAGGRSGDPWADVKNLLAGARVVAGLGDNHATGVGCGLEEDDFETVVVSAGTSGTINRVCTHDADLRGDAACFEYYENRLLLIMLADCCRWYDRFVAKFARDYKDRLDELNESARRANLAGVRRVLHRNGRETYPPNWDGFSLGEKAASTQFSIGLELLSLVKAMQAEVTDAARPLTTFVLTGGLSQSPFFQQVFSAGVKLLAPKARIAVSGRQGPLRYQTAAYGALLNAMRPEHAELAKKLCPLRACAKPDSATRAHLQYLLRSCGL